MAIATPSPSSFDVAPAAGRRARGHRSGAGDPPAIRLAGVRKRFRKYTVRGGYTTLKTSLVNRIFRRKFPSATISTCSTAIDLDVARRADARHHRAQWIRERARC